MRIIFFTVLLDLVGFGILIPIQPFLASAFGASPKVITALGASFSLMQFLFAPFWGRLSDAYGRRPIMLLTISISAVGYLGFALAQSLTGLFIARMLSGFGAANVGIAQAMIADSTDEKNRARGMGIIGAAFGLGFILGPLFGGLLVRFGLSAPAFLGFALCTLNVIFAWRFLPETLTERGHSEARGWQLWPSAKLLSMIKLPNVALIFFTYLVFTTGFALMEQVLALFIAKFWEGDNGYRRSAELTAYVMISVGIASTFVQGFAIGPLSKKLGEKRLLIVGPLIVSLTFAFLAWLGGYQVFWNGNPVLLVFPHAQNFNFSILLVTTVVMALGVGLINPSLSSLLSRSVDKDVRGVALGMGQSFSSLGRFLGPAVSGFLFEMTPGMPFLFGSWLIFACFALNAFLKQPAD